MSEPRKKTLYTVIAYYLYREQKVVYEGYNKKLAYRYYAEWDYYAQDSSPDQGGPVDIKIFEKEIEK